MASRRGYRAENSFAITCAADDEDAQAHNADRLYLCKHLAGALYERFKLRVTADGSSNLNLKPPCRKGPGRLLLRTT